MASVGKRCDGSRAPKTEWRNGEKRETSKRRTLTGLPSSTYRALLISNKCRTSVRGSTLYTWRAVAVGSVGGGGAKTWAHDGGMSEYLGFGTWVSLVCPSALCTEICGSSYLRVLAVEHTKRLMVQRILGGRGAPQQ